MTSLPAVTSNLPSLANRVGFWMCAFLVAYLFFNVARSLMNPVGFAVYYGIPLTDPNNTPFVYVYALRTLFIALFALVLVIRQDYTLLTWLVFIGAVLPIGDAVLVGLQGGATSIVIRHSLIAVFLLVTAFLLRRPS
ncbi:MAG: DUF4267 domain-containing protein [Phototrophicaceae bacterium]|jgi:hypothetical protein